MFVVVLQKNNIKWRSITLNLDEANRLVEKLRPAFPDHDLTIEEHKFKLHAELPKDYVPFIKKGPDG